MKKITVFVLIVAISAVFTGCEIFGMLISGLDSGSESEPTYSVTYMPNGATSGSVPVDGNAYKSGRAVTVYGNSGALSRSGYVFNGWNTAADGSGTSHFPGTKITVTANVTLYAIWAPALKVSYNANGADSGTAPSDATEYISGAGVTLKTPGTLSKTGFFFNGWSLNADGSGDIYFGEASYTITGAVTFYARWVPDGTTYYTVTYAPNTNDVTLTGSSPFDANRYLFGQQATIRDNGTLERTQYIFHSWNTQADGLGTALVAGSKLTVTGDTTVYAHWTLGYQVIYDGNGADGGSVPVDPNGYKSGATATILDNSITTPPFKNGYEFDSWNTVANGSGTRLVAGSTLTITGTTTVYAQWNERRTFKSVNISNNQPYNLSAICLATGSHCRVFVEEESTTTWEMAHNVATEFDANIFDKINDNFGTPSDVDDNGKTILLLLDIKDGYNGSGGYVAGFFAPLNMYAKETEPDSNEADMLFMDTYPAEAGSSAFYETIAHEFQHLVNFSNTVMGSGENTNPQDLWINEGLSSGAEYVYSGAVSADRVDWFNADQLGTIKNGNNFFVWYGDIEDTNADSVLDNYATVSLFFQWLRIHATNTTAIYKEILESDYRDYRCVTGAAANRIGSSFEAWETLLSTWHLANVLDQNSGFYGYGTDFPTVSMPAYVSSQNNEQCSLAPGEAILSAMPSGGNTPPSSGANIKYLGIASDGTVDSVSPYSGNKALVFNANSNCEEEVKETGFIANVAQAETSILFNRVSAVKPRPTSWAVDVHIGTGGKVNEIDRKQLDRGEEQ